MAGSASRFDEALPSSVTVCPTATGLGLTESCGFGTTPLHPRSASVESDSSTAARERRLGTGRTLMALTEQRPAGAREALALGLLLHLDVARDLERPAQPRVAAVDGLAIDMASRARAAEHLHLAGRLAASTLGDGEQGAQVSPAAEVEQ